MDKNDTVPLMCGGGLGNQSVRQSSDGPKLSLGKGTVVSQGTSGGGDSRQKEQYNYTKKGIEVRVSFYDPRT